MKKKEHKSKTSKIELAEQENRQWTQLRRDTTRISKRRKWKSILRTRRSRIRDSRCRREKRSCFWCSVSSVAAKSALLRNASKVTDSSNKESQLLMSRTQRIILLGQWTTSGDLFITKLSIWCRQNQIKPKSTKWKTKKLFQKSQESTSARVSGSSSGPKERMIRAPKLDLRREK